MLMSFVSCGNEANKNKYEMDLLSEGLYKLEDATDVAIYKDSVFFYSRNTIISIDFNNISKTKTIYKSDSDISALTINATGVWAALTDGRIIKCDLNDSSSKEYKPFEEAINIYNLVVDNDSALLFTEKIVDDYRQTIIYEFNFNSGNLINLSEKFLPSGRYSSCGYLSGGRKYFLYNNVPVSDYSTLIICNSSKILNTYKIKGPIFNGDYNLLNDSLIYSLSGNLYEYNLLSEESSIISGSAENYIDKIFATGKNIIAWTKKASILEVISVPDQENFIQILIPDDKSSTINYKMSEISKKYKSKTGTNIEIKLISVEGYLEKIRLKLLEQDDSFDLFFVQDIREDQILHSLMNYSLYIPINNISQLNEFCNNGCFDFIKDALSDKNGNIYGLPLYTAYSVLHLNPEGRKYFNSDRLSFEDIYKIIDLIPADTSLFYNINTAYTLFNHLLSSIINNGGIDSSEEIIQQYLSELKKLNDQNKLYGGKNYLFYDQSLFSIGGAADITKGVVSYPSLNNVDIETNPVYIGDLLVINKNTRKEKLVGDFLNFVINEYLYDPHYTNGLIGSDLEKYKTLFGANQFEDNTENKSAFENLNILNSYPILFDFTNYYSDIDSILEGNSDIGVVAKSITQTLKQWMLE